MTSVDSARAAGVRILHCSDIHCGRPFVQAHVDAALALARAFGVTVLLNAAFWIWFIRR